MSSTTLRVATTRDDHRIAWLAALAIGLHVLEAAIPSPVPGFKPGFANIVTVLVLLQFNWRSAAWVSALRVIVGSLILGTFLSPTFLLSLSGMLGSIGILGLAQVSRIRFGAIGLSVLAAMAHMGCQFLAAYTLFVPHQALLLLLPVLMTAAVVFGIINGIMAAMILERSRHIS